MTIDYKDKQYNSNYYEYIDPHGRNVIDPYGRNVWGTPPKKCADYAFQQHIQNSLDVKNGRSITLWPHGILFRDSESEIRKNMIKSDVVECVIGLGPNLFYNSPMEACLLITKNSKITSRKKKILLINAINEIQNERNISFLSEKNIEKIFDVYKTFKEVKNFSKIITIEKILENKGSLNISNYISNVNKKKGEIDLKNSLENWKSHSQKTQDNISVLLKSL